MNKRILIAILLAALPMFAQTDTQWVLEQSTLTYHISHPIHLVESSSHAAKGKGVCHAGECEFLIAAPVKSFDSGDSNRDLHMLEATRGAQFPMVIVRTQIPEGASTSATIYADLEVEFAGQTAHYQHVPFQRRDPRKRSADIGNNSGNVFRFQDRQAIVSDGTYQERNPGECGDDLAPDVKLPL